MTIEYTNDRVSPATIELLIGERNKGKSLRQVGQMFGRSGERVRQLLAKYDGTQVRLLPEKRVAARMGYPNWWLVQLRKKGLVKPKHGDWLYSEEQVRQIPSLIAETKRCERCGRLRPPHSSKFCRECRQYRRKHPYEFMSPEAKARKAKRDLARRKANPERSKQKRRRLPISQGTW